MEECLGSVLFVDVIRKTSSNIFAADFFNEKNKTKNIRAFLLKLFVFQ